MTRMCTILEEVSSRSTDLKLGCKLNTKANQFNHILIFFIDNSTRTNFVQYTMKNRREKKVILTVYYNLMRITKMQ